MDMGIDAQPEEPAPRRTQVGTHGLHCSAHAGQDGEPVICMTGQSFPSLQLWDFGLLAKAGVSLEHMHALTAHINEICDGACAEFDDGRDMSGKELYETDEWGLAKLE